MSLLGFLEAIFDVTYTLVLAMSYYLDGVSHQTSAVSIQSDVKLYYLYPVCIDRKRSLVRVVYFGKLLIMSQ